MPVIADPDSRSDTIAAFGQNFHRRIALPAITIIGYPKVTPIRCIVKRLQCPHEPTTWSMLLKVVGEWEGEEIIRDE